MGMNLTKEQKLMIKLKLQESEEKAIEQAKEEIKEMKEKGHHRHAQKLEEQYKENYNDF